MITNVRQRFDALATSIRSHPLLELLDYNVHPPVTDDVIAEAEARLHLTVPVAVRSLYETFDGMSLQWRFKPDVPPETQTRIKEELHPLTETPETAFTVAGNVHILPLQDLLLNEEYALPQTTENEGEFDFDGKRYSDTEFARMLRPFDEIDEYFCMAFVVQPERDNWKLLLLSDYWIEYDHSRTTWVDDYLEFVIATWGLRMARDRIFSKYRGDRESPLSFDGSLISGLVPPMLQGGS
jgi:hypothetical protein